MRIGLVLLLLLCGFAGPRPASAHGAYHDVVADLRARLARNRMTPRCAFNSPRRMSNTANGRPVWTKSRNRGARTRSASDRVAFRTRSRGIGAIRRGRALLRGASARTTRRSDRSCGAGRIRLKQGHVKEGIEDYRAALRSSAKPELYVETCEALRRNGMAREALAVVDEGVVRCGADPAILVCAVECAGELGEVDAGIAYLDRLQRVWPRPEPWMQRKAEFLAQAGRNEEATAAWRSLHDHLLALPNLERSQPLLADTLAACRRALGIETPPAVVAPPAD